MAYVVCHWSPHNRMTSPSPLSRWHKSIYSYTVIHSYTIINSTVIVLCLLKRVSFLVFLGPSKYPVFQTAQHLAESSRFNGPQFRFFWTRHEYAAMICNALGRFFSELLQGGHEWQWARHSGIDPPLRWSSGRILRQRLRIGLGVPLWQGASCFREMSNCKAFPEISEMRSLSGLCSLQLAFNSLFP